MFLRTELAGFLYICHTKKLVIFPWHTGVNVHIRWLPEAQAQELRPPALFGHPRRARWAVSLPCQCATARPGSLPLRSACAHAFLRVLLLLLSALGKLATSPRPSKVARKNICVVLYLQSPKMCSFECTAESYKVMVKLEGKPGMKTICEGRRQGL